MEPSQLFDLMGELQLYGMKAAFDEVVTTAVKRQPGIQFVEVLEPQPRREEAFADEPNLILDLPLLPAGSRRAGDRIDEVVAAHLEKAAIVEASSPAIQLEKLVVDLGTKFLSE
jgi:hypothetical protein